MLVLGSGGFEHEQLAESGAGARETSVRGSLHLLRWPGGLLSGTGVTLLDNNFS